MTGRESFRFEAEPELARSAHMRGMNADRGETFTVVYDPDDLDDVRSSRLCSCRLGSSPLRSGVGLARPCALNCSDQAARIRNARQLRKALTHRSGKL